MSTNPTLYDNFQRVKNWSENKFAYKGEIPSIDLSAYVTKVELDEAAYISTIPSEYITDSELSAYGYATQSYVTDAISAIPEPDLSAYVTKTELNNAGYITSIPSEYVTDSELSACSYATQAYVTDAISAIPEPDLSAYVTKTELNNAGYITSIPSEYITQDELSANAYLTSADVDITGNIIPSKKNTYTLGNISYMYKTTYTNEISAGYLDLFIKSSGVNTVLFGNSKIIPINDTYMDLGNGVNRWKNFHAGNTYTDNLYINNNNISDVYASKSYVESYVSTAISEIPTVDLSAYVTKTELNNAGYISSIPSEYITDSELSACSYATQTYVTDAISAIPSVDLSAYATKSYVVNYVATYAPIPDLSAYVTKIELNNAGYITSIPSEYITDSELSACGYVTQLLLSNNSYATITQVNGIFSYNSSTGTLTITTIN